MGVTGYTVLRDGALLATTADPSWVDTSVQSSTTYDYQVLASDAAGNASASSAMVEADVPQGPDLTPPSAPGSLTAHAVDARTVHLTWADASDDVGVAGYDVLRDGAVLAVGVQVPDYVDTTVDDSTTYTYRVRAVDTSGNVGGLSPPATVLTPDATPPSVVPGVAASASGAHAVQVAWQAATDNVGVVGYRVFRDGQQVGSTTGQGFTELRPRRRDDLPVPRLSRGRGGERRSTERSRRGHDR